MSTFERLVQEALNAPFKGWDFSYIEDTGRIVESPLTWHYSNYVRPYLEKAETMLDMGTGGGEVLSRFAPLPVKTFATESYLLNVDVARKRLSPLGVEVVYVEEAKKPPYFDYLPFDDCYFDLIINRHEPYSPREIKRILKKKGVFITQQVGCFNAANLQKDLLGSQADAGNWNLRSAILELQECGFIISTADEQIDTFRFYDIGAVVYFLKAIPWVIDDFSLEKYREELLYLHTRIEQDGYYDVLQHRFILTAEK